MKTAERREGTAKGKVQTAERREKTPEEREKTEERRHQRAYIFKNLIISHSHITKTSNFWRMKLTKKKVNIWSDSEFSNSERWKIWTNW